ncbi:MAG TPA: NUDIX domain-containing protein [Saprospiraceae bacterium]|nr:NUDIX domain-containing protein [Saprospiraceae bacterium]HPI07755.1 NUDIX domain-containing protein [Saprospiraceae bacterium]
MPKKSGTGIIVGRFQVFELNKVHSRLVTSVLQKHSQVAIYLASNPAPGLHNPLDFELRRLMFEEKYKDKLRIEEMPDLPDDRIWSQELDRRILEIRPEGTVTLYGTRDNFVDRYSGRYTAEVLEAHEDDFPEEPELSTLSNLRDFRAGMIYANIRRFPTVYPTVDIAVFRRDYTEVLLARKSNETRYRFPGGFTDPADPSYEDAVLRELGEECGELTIDELTYLGSSKIDDWRYRDAFDSIMTHMYACALVDGKPSPNDDIAEVQWFELERLTEDLFVAEHRPLFEIMMDYLEEMDEEEDED